MRGTTGTYHITVVTLYGPSWMGLLEVVVWIWTFVGDCAVFAVERDLNLRHRS
jgi:hypothetical protein